jgi:hypothetical protein
MAAQPYRCTVTIDGTKFDAVSTSIRFHTEKDRTGMPMMGSLDTKIRVIADFHDDKNLPFSSLKKFFDLANVVDRSKIKEMKIEYWKDDSHEDALVSFSFQGWISRFETANPHPLGMAALRTDEDFANNPAAAYPQLNHVLVLDLVPTLSKEKFKDIQISK